MSDIAVDTNVLIYLHDKSDDVKRSKANVILANNPKIPTQVISEYLNTTRRLLPLSKEDLLIQTAALFTSCETIPTSISTLSLAALLIKKYRFQLFDAVIVAASLEGACKTLLSEDMHNGLVINGALTIINPFL